MADKETTREHERIAALAQHCLAKNLRASSRIVSNFYDDKMRATGIHANQVTMLAVPYLAGSIGINRMAAHLGLDRTTLVRNLKLIERQGLVTIKPGTD